jgi:hypothetical protein
MNNCIEAMNKCDYMLINEENAPFYPNTASTPVPKSENNKVFQIAPDTAPIPRANAYFYF